MNRDSYYKTLSENLRSIRRSKGLTTVDLAKILGVSQAKISYIEHCKGVLSARDIAILSRRLDIPVTEFFRGLDKIEESSRSEELVGHLVRYGANLLSKPRGLILKEVPFEEVFSEALGFVDDDRFHKGFCAALIIQAGSKEINVDRIFALIGDNPFLVTKIAEEARICLQVIATLNRTKELVRPRAGRQIDRIGWVAEKLLGKAVEKSLSPDEIEDLATFVGGCLHAERRDF